MEPAHCLGEPGQPYETISTIMACPNGMRSVLQVGIGRSGSSPKLRAERT